MKKISVCNGGLDGTTCVRRHHCRRFVIAENMELEFLAQESEGPGNGEGCCFFWGIYDSLKMRIFKVLKSYLNFSSIPPDTKYIDISSDDGIVGGVIVSELFVDMDQKDRQCFIWKIFTDSLTEDERARLGYFVTLSSKEVEE